MAILAFILSRNGRPNCPVTTRRLLIVAQHPLDDMSPNRLPRLDEPTVDGIEGEQSGVDEAAGTDAVLFGASAVVLLGLSPGNCTAVSGLTDAEAPDAFADPVAVPPDDTAPPPVDPAASVAVGTLRGSQPVAVEHADPEMPVPPELVTCAGSIWVLAWSPTWAGATWA